MSIARELVASIKRKRAIDRANETSVHAISYDQWVTDAVELLLMIELDKLNDQLKAELEPLPELDRRHA